MNDISAIRIVENIRRLSNKRPYNNMVFGEVVSIDPLRIDIGNNVILTKNFLYLGQMCRPHKVTIPHTHVYNGNTESSSLTTTATVGSSTTPGTIAPNPHSHQIKDQVTEDVHYEGTDYEENVVMEIYPKLKVGDKVLMFVMNDSQMYYVAERVESVE